MMTKTISALAVLTFIVGTCLAQDAHPTLALTTRGVAAAPTASGAASLETLTVPAETEAAVTMLSGLHTRMSQVNDPVTAQLQQAVYVDGQIGCVDGHRVSSFAIAREASGSGKKPQRADGCRLWR